MNWLHWAGIIIASSTTYQVLVKLQSAKLPVSVYMMLMTGTMFLLSTVFFLVTSKTSFHELVPDKKVLLWPILIGMAGFVIDFGYVYLYKHNAPLSLARTVILAGILVCLLVIGIVFLHERFTIPQIIGAVFCMIGLYAMVMYKPV